jgi:hypothetical protein
MAHALRAAAGASLTLQEMQQSLPAIFATQPYQSCSDRYAHIDTGDILAHLGQHGFVPVEARAVHACNKDRRPFVRHAIRLRSRDDLMPRQVGGVVFEAVLRNSHDGTSAYTFSAGVFRLMCLNGMMVKSDSLADIHIRHTGNRQALLTAVAKGTQATVDQAPAVMRQIESWQRIRLSSDAQRVYAEQAHRLRFADAHGRIHVPIAPAQLLHARRPGDDGPSLWDTFQRVQENAVRGGLTAMRYDASSGRQRRYTTRAVTGIEADARLNKALWAMTEQLAQQFH